MSEAIRPEVHVGITSGDICGADHRAIQAALDYVAGLGGGTVRLGPGEWLLRDSLRLSSHVTLVGAGEATILRKAPGGQSLLAEDGDYGDRRILPRDPSLFQVGDGVTVRSDGFGGFFSAVATVIRQEPDGALVLDALLNADLMVAHGACVSQACPLIRATDVADLTVRDLVLDGNRAACPPEDGCRGGGINFLRVAGVHLSGLLVRDVNGDGVSYQNSPDVVIEDCCFEGNAGGGCHPGSGAARPVVRRCTMRGNGGCGLFLCWRVKRGLFADNLITDNAQMGISIGHKDTDNHFLRNEIRGNGLSGVYFRDEARHAAGHGCLVEACVIENNGAGGEHHDGPAAGVRIDGETDHTVLRHNAIQQSPALWIGPRAGKVTVEGSVNGEVCDLRAP